MSTESPGIAHHTVPRVYLKGFQRDRHVLVYSKGSYAPPELVPIRRVSVIEDFYSVVQRDGTFDESHEAQLSRLENRYRNLLRRVRSTEALTTEEHLALALIASVQEARSTAQHENWTGNMERLTDMVEAMYRHHSPNAAPAEIEARMHEFVRENIIDAELDRAPQNLARPLAFANVDFRYTLLAYMHLSILESRAQNFVTCDQPVAWFDPTDWPPAQLREYPAFRLSLEVTFPLSKRHCALFTWMPTAARAQADAEIVRTVNARTAAFSHREVYATPVDSAIDRSRILVDLSASENELRRPLLYPLMEPGGSIDILNVCRHRFVNVDPAEVRHANEPLLEVWRRTGFANVQFAEDQAG